MADAEMNVDDLVSNAKLAEQAERYDDMAAAMKEVRCAPQTQRIYSGRVAC